MQFHPARDFNIRLVILLISLTLTACGGGRSGDGGGNGKRGDVRIPTVTGITPVDASAINGSKQMVITFSESMDTTTLSLGGDLGTEDDGGLWSKTTHTDDTLTLSPASTWKEGSERTLIIGASDLAGNALATLNLSYTVDITDPTVTGISPVDTSSISGSKQIMVIFSESMDTGTLSLGGDLGGEADGGVWSSTSNTDDTLTLSPVSTWTGGIGRTLTLDAMDLAGNPIVTESLNYTVDAMLPTAVVDPANGSAFDEHASIVVTFSESMNTTTNLGGDLSGEDDGGVWSTTTNTNDTLTLSPASTWTLGRGRTLSIDAEDLAGNTLATLNLSYTVENAVYVTTAANGGSDSNDGSAESPLLTIAAAITRADSKYTTAEVRVAEGLYNVDYSVGSHIKMVEGVSLYGGYAADWSSRDPVRYTTTITDTSGIAESRAVEVNSDITAVTVIDGFTITANELEYSAAVFIINSAPTIQNNIINGGSGGEDIGYSYGILLENSGTAIIRNNTINGGYGYLSFAIFNSASSPIISGNTINAGGSGVSLSSSFGIQNWLSSPTIENNTINGGNSVKGGSYCIFNSSSSSTIRNNILNSGYARDSVGIETSYSSLSNTIHNNTIRSHGSVVSIGIRIGSSSSVIVSGNTINSGDSGVAGSTTAGITVNDSPSSSTNIIRNNIIDGGGGTGTGTKSMGIYIAVLSSPTIENNIVFTSSGSAARYCILESYASGDPAVVRNNNLFDCPTALYRDYDGGGDLTSISAMEADLVAEGIATGGNTSVNPNLVNHGGGDWQFKLDGSSPCAVTKGGLDGASEGWSFTHDKEGIPRTGDGLGTGWSMGAYEFDGTCAP